MSSCLRIALGVSVLLSALSVVCPVGQASDAMIYVSGYQSNNILRYDAVTGAFIGEFVHSGNGGLNGPEQMAFGPDGNLYVASSYTASVKRYDGTTGAYLGDFASGHGMYLPRGIAFGPDGNLYVAGAHNSVKPRSSRRRAALKPS